jgi:predicted MFS family arabinose efflux permease
VGGVVGASLVQALTRRLGTARTLVLCKAGAGPCALVVPFTADDARLVLFVAGSVLVTTGIVAGNVVSASFRQAYVPPQLLGRVVTSMQLLNVGTVPLGALLAGALATATTTRTAVAVLTVAYALSGLLLVLGPLRGRRDLPGRPPLTGTAAALAR